jgi:hypothetical protein
MPEAFFRHPAQPIYSISGAAAMSDDLRCCGTGTCIINAEGQCWCGQRWDGEKMCFPEAAASPAAGAPSLATKSDATTGIEPQA